MLNFLFMMLIGIGAPAAVFWIKPRDSGWDNTRMTFYFVHCLFFLLAAYGVGYWRGTH